MASDEGGGVGAELEHGGGHLLRLTEATDRLGGHHPRQPLRLAPEDAVEQRGH
jgi:hypothetical protein